MIHGDVGTLQQGVLIFTRQRIESDTDADTQIKFMLLDFEGLANGLENFFGNSGHRFLGGNIGQQQSELITTETTQSIFRSQTAQNPF